MGAIAAGTLLNGKWLLGAQLGVGGAGTVYAATHRNGTHAAVKILHPELARDDDQVARFLREGMLANRLRHAGAVAALDDDRTEDGLVYLVLELLDGASLAMVIEERGPMPTTLALGIADQILDVLAAAHDVGIVHRDVKPGNVIMLAGGTIKLLDFGVARAEHGESAQPYPRASATCMGAVFGTPGFMPPEQARGRTELVDERTDVWAASAVLFAMLTGRRLHDAETTNEVLARAMNEPAPPLRQIVPDMPEVVARVVDRGLAFAREDRFQSARAMQEAVRFAQASLLGCASESSDEPSLLAERARSSPALASSLRRAMLRSVGYACLLLCTCAVVAAAWAGSATDSPAPGHAIIDSVTDPVAESSRLASSVGPSLGTPVDAAPEAPAPTITTSPAAARRWSPRTPPQRAATSSLPDPLGSRR